MPYLPELTNRTIAYWFLWIALLNGLLLLNNHNLRAQPITPENTSIQFAIRNAGLQVNGQFTAFSGRANLQPEQPGATSVKVTIDVASIDTGIGMRDKHLRNEDYFHVEKYPQIIFESTGWEIQNQGYLLKGKITIKETTKNIEIPVKKVTQGDVIAWEGEVKLDRLAFKVGGKSMILSNEVRAHFTFRQPR